MLKIVISGSYFKNDWFFSSFNARVKKDMVYFYDYDEVIGYILDRLSYWELQRLRLNIYDAYHDYIKFTNFRESDINWEVFEWVKILSPVIDLDYSDFAELLPNRDIRKKYFEFDKIRERYYLKSDFINYVKFHVV